MQPPEFTRVKVCCMKSIEEVWMAIEAGASAVGLVSPLLDRQAVQAPAIIAAFTQLSGDVVGIVEIAVKDGDPPAGQDRGPPHAT